MTGEIDFTCLNLTGVVAIALRSSGSVQFPSTSAAAGTISISLRIST